MPIYEYECELCGVFEVMQKASDKPLKAKPDCQQKKCPKTAQRIISQSAFHLKGGGWYKNDYASKSKTAENSMANKETSTAKSETSSDNKDKTEKKSLAKAKGPCGGGCACH